MKAAGFNEIHGRLEQIAKILLKFAEVEDIAASVEVDQKVDLAGRPVLPADEGTEDAHIARSVLLRQFEDGGTLFGLQRVERHGGLSLLCLNNERRGRNDDTTVVKVAKRNS